MAVINRQDSALDYPLNYSTGNSQKADRQTVIVFVWNLNVLTKIFLQQDVKM